ncbi:MAG: DUF1289 domain-containing protein [Pseudomonadota bacterium]
MSKLPSPCIDVCKFKRKGHCIGCSMTKDQKKTFKKLDKEKHREAFIAELQLQQSRLGKYKGWAIAYTRKCLKKGFDPRRVGLG